MASGELLAIAGVGVALYLYLTGHLCNITGVQALCPGGASPAQQKNIASTFNQQAASLQKTQQLLGGSAYAYSGYIAAPLSVA
jgi:hypothetical protein